MKHCFLIMPLLLLSSCGGNISRDSSNNLEILCKGDNYEVLGKMSYGLISDSLFYFRHDTLVFKQYWENGSLLSTEFRDNDRFRKLKYVSQKIDSLNYHIYYTDAQDTSFKIYPYDMDITNFYYKVKSHNVVKFKSNEPSIINIYNIPQEICKMAVVGGIVKRQNEGYSITPTRHKNDTLKVFYVLNLIGFPSEYESFVIE